MVIVTRATLAPVRSKFHERLDLLWQWGPAMVAVVLVVVGLVKLVRFLIDALDLALVDLEFARILGLCVASLAIPVAVIAIRRRVWPTPPTHDELLREAATVAIADFTPGSVQKIVGRLSLEGEPLKAPLTGRGCAAYEAYVREDSFFDSFDSERELLSIHETHATPFIITDATGRARVNPKNAVLMIGADETSRSGKMLQPTPAQQAFLFSHGELANSRSRGSLDYYEGVLETGDLVAVFGRGILVEDADGTSILELRAEDQAPLRISDVPKPDGA